MSETPTDAQRLAAVGWARENLYEYSRWMHWQQTGNRWVRGPHHRRVADALMRVFRGECPRLIINEPPGYSKTQQVKDFVTWSLGKVPDCAFIYTSFASERATAVSWEMRERVEHPAHQEIFPGLHLHEDSRAIGKWRTTAGGILVADGAGGALTGFDAGRIGREGFAGALIIDDPLKPKEARSDDVRRQVNENFEHTLERRLRDKRTPIILIMQRLHEDDYTQWLLNHRKDDGWEHICLPALQPDGTALWPERHDVQALQRMQRESPYMFAGQYQQSPSVAEGNIFTPDAMPVFEAVPFGTRFVRGWDLGASDADGDPTVGFKLGLMPDGRYIIANVRSLMGRPDDVQKAVLNTAQSDGRETQISIPQDPGQAGKAQVAAFAKLLTGFRVHFSLESGDKITRSEPFAAQVNVGNVAMLRAAWNDALVSEMRIFPNGRDDQEDAGARAFNRLTRRGRLALASI